MTNSDTPEQRLPSREPDAAAEQSSENTVLVEDVQPAPESGDGTSSVETASASETLSFVDMLVMAGMLAKEQAYVAQETARREKLPLWRVLVRDGLVVSQDLAALTALHRGLTMVDLRNQTIDHDAVAILPEQVSRKYSVLPIRVHDGTLTVAMPDPTDLQVIQDLSAFTGLTLDPVVATAEDVLEHIDVSYRLIENTAEESTSETGAASRSARVTAQRLRDAPPAQIIDLLLQQGVQDRASDIHIVPAETRLRVRFRIDGVLQDVMSLPMELAPTIISRLKIMGGMNIAERRRPQDGQFSADLQNRQVDVRVAMSNTVNGEMAVLRLLDKGFALFGLNQLGMSPQALEQYRRLLRLPYGMIVICGPTGSGKSTSLYASILQMNRVEHNVISLEDPVEYRIGDVNQTQVQAEAGITFATQLRSVLRLDPDVILVGEIRDQETAVIATQAALTGHLVLTSLHANDSAGALVRLRDLGVAPYLIASSVAGISVTAYGSQCLHQLSSDDASPRCGAEGLRGRDGRGAGTVYLRRRLQHVCADRLPRTQRCLRDIDDDRLYSPAVPGRCGARRNLATSAGGRPNSPAQGWDAESEGWRNDPLRSDARPVQLGVAGDSRGVQVRSLQ